MMQGRRRKEAEGAFGSSFGKVTHCSTRVIEVDAHFV
jgi:hypothetical protein